MSIFARFIIGIFISLSLFSFAKADVYPDVNPGYKHYDAIIAMTKRQVIEGYPDGLFRPEAPINRAEAVKILIGANFDPYTINRALDNYQSSYTIFPDVPTKEWYAKYIKVSYDNDIVDGYPNGLFKPAISMNFAEALKVILESHDVNPYVTPYKNNELLYMEKTDWFQPYASYAWAHNLLNKEKFYFFGKPITRGEFVEVIWRLQEMKKYNLNSFVDETEDTSNQYEITIPKLGLFNVNVDFANIYNIQAAIESLKRGFGHYLARPNEEKSFIIFGHSSDYWFNRNSFDKLLANINQLQNGDKIYINYKEKGYVYQIYHSEIIPEYQDGKMLEDKHENRMIMYTCWPPGSISHRYIVYAKPIL